MHNDIPFLWTPPEKACPKLTPFFRGIPPRPQKKKKRPPPQAPGPGADLLTSCPAAIFWRGTQSEGGKLTGFFDEGSFKELPGYEIRISRGAYATRGERLERFHQWTALLGLGLPQNAPVEESSNRPCGACFFFLGGGGEGGGSQGSRWHNPNPCRFGHPTDLTSHYYLGGPSNFCGQNPSVPCFSPKSLVSSIFHFLMAFGLYCKANQPEVEISPCLSDFHILFHPTRHQSPGPPCSAMRKAIGRNPMLRNNDAKRHPPTTRNTEDHFLYLVQIWGKP